MYSMCCNYASNTILLEQCKDDDDKHLVFSTNITPCLMHEHMVITNHELGSFTYLGSKADRTFQSSI